LSQFLVDELLEQHPPHRRDRLLRHRRHLPQELVIFLQGNLELVALDDELLWTLGPAAAGEACGSAQHRSAFHRNANAPGNPAQHAILEHQYPA
jgi:hypothetical protein